jgi:hypothetical protein
MNNYITLNGTKFRTKGTEWKPKVKNPGTVRFTVLGELDATYAPGTMYVWEGKIMADVTPDAGFGTPDQLRAILKTKAMLTLIDHYGTTFDVTVLDYEEGSLAFKWDSPSNVMYFKVKLEGALA